MNNIYALITAITLFLAAIVGTALLIISKTLIKRYMTSDKGTILNTFPGELNEVLGNKDKLLYISLVSIFSFLSLLGYVLVFSGMLVIKDDSNFSPSALIVPIFLIIVSFACMIAMWFSMMINLSKTRNFLIASISYICLLSAIGIFPLLVVKFDYMLQPNYIIAYINMALGFVSILTLANPKIKTGFYLEKTEVNGATYWLRPKINWLATTIWFNYGMNIVLLITNGISAILAIYGLNPVYLIQ